MFAMEFFQNHFAKIFFYANPFRIFEKGLTVAVERLTESQIVDISFFFSFPFFLKGFFIPINAKSLSLV